VRTGSFDGTPELKERSHSLLTTDEETTHFSKNYKEMLK
jgi:hypothetical protein